MNEREIFLEALTQTDPAVRNAYLDEVCGDDSTLRARLDELLAGYHDVASVLERNPAHLVGIDTRQDAEAVARDCVSIAEPEALLRPYLERSKHPDALGRLGHYELLEVVGHGGFGIVVKAFDENLHRIVAIKVLMPHLAKTSPPRKRFLREARSAAVVNHENVIKIYAVEEDPLPYLAMEYIDGRSLQQLLDEFGPLEPAEVLRLGRQIALGLAAAHERGLVHRDVKPANILLESRGEMRVKLTDFGIARTVDAASSTQSGLLAGTPMFMAPEQIRGESLDHRADLFSLGSVLYTMTVGHPPFRASNTFAVLKRVAEDTPRPIRQTMPETPEALQAIIACLHRKDPQERFATAHDVADALANGLQGSITLPSRKSRRSAWKTPAIAAIALGLLLALGWSLGQMPSSFTWWLGGSGPASKPDAARRMTAAKPVVTRRESEEDASVAAARDTANDVKVEARTDEERWQQAMALLPAEERAQAVVARLKKRNPACVDPKAGWRIEDDAVVRLEIGDSHELLDLGPLRGLRGLRELRLVGQEHLDLGPLRGMRLTNFDSNGNLIEDLSPLSGMPLQWLGIWGYAKSDLSVLRGMNQLQGLNCGASGVRDLAPLRGLPLNYLCLNFTQVADLSPLTGMPLRTLEIERTAVSDLTPIADLPLERLCLRGAPIGDYSPLAGLPLKTLRLDYRRELHEQLLRSIPTLETVNEQPVARFLSDDRG